MVRVQEAAKHKQGGILTISKIQLENRGPTQNTPLSNTIINKVIKQNETDVIITKIAPPQIRATPRAYQSNSSSSSFEIGGVEKLNSMGCFNIPRTKDRKTPTPMGVNISAMNGPSKFDL